MTSHHRVVFLDGIRGWAAFIVVVTHLVTNFLGLTTPSLNFTKEQLMADLAGHHFLDALIHAALRFMTDGHLAVLIFFVLSGYALSVAHLDPQRRALGLAAAARYFRLMIPILVTSLMACLLLQYGLFFNREVARVTPAYAGWLGSFYSFEPDFFKAIKFSLHDVFLKYDDVGTYNSSLWTMRAELYGSVFIYLYLAMFRRTDQVHWKTIGFLFVLLYLLQPLYACFVAGLALAEWQRKTRDGHTIIDSTLVQRALPWVFAAAAIGSAFVRGDDRITLLIAIAIVFSVCFSRGLKVFFSNRLSAFLGKISFPLYLVQILVLCSWSAYLCIHLPTLGWSQAQTSYFVILSSLIVCVVVSVCLLPLERFSVVCSKKMGGLVLSGARMAWRGWGRARRVLARQRAEAPAMQHSDEGTLSQ